MFCIRDGGAPKRFSEQLAGNDFLWMGAGPLAINNAMFRS
jgi:hypothetical protein